MVPLDNFLPRLLPYTLGAAQPLAIQSLLDAAIQFCEETGVVRVTTSPVLTRIGQATYDVGLASQTELSRVLKVWVGGSLVYASPEAMTDKVQGVSTEVQNDTGTIREVHVIEPGTITLVGPPDKDDLQIVVRAATRPTRSAKQVDDELFNRWCDAIVSGAIYRMASIPGQPFSDMSQAQHALSMFWQQVNRAKIQANRGPTGSPLAVKMRRFA